jgi:hypothetical protein
VGVVQDVLERLHYLSPGERATDNAGGKPFYGGNTTFAMKQFQKDEGLVPVPISLSGAVTERTWARLQTIQGQIGAGDQTVGAIGQQAVNQANVYWDQGANGEPLDRQHADNVNKTLAGKGVDAGTDPYTPDGKGGWKRTTVDPSDPKDVNWCGMFATMVLQDVGFGGDGKSFNQALLSTADVRGFFTYHPNIPARDPSYIADRDPAGGVQVMKVIDYHHQRYQMRRWLGPAEVAAALQSGRRDFAQPGDVVTFGDDAGDHITLVDQLVDDGQTVTLVTIEGNAWGPRGSVGGPDGTGNEGVVKNTRTLSASGNSVMSTFKAAGVNNETPINGIGRYSPIDFETHVYGSTESDARTKASTAPKAK